MPTHIQVLTMGMSMSACMYLEMKWKLRQVFICALRYRYNLLSGNRTQSINMLEGSYRREKMTKAESWARNTRFVSYVHTYAN